MQFKCYHGNKDAYNVYGYFTKPIGKLKLNKKGQAKYEGMVPKINLDEADIVKRIYKEFIEGKSISKIVKDLNRDKVPTKKGYSGGWNTSTVSRILKNEKYAGLWIWRKWKNIRVPMTGKIKKVPRAKEERLSSFKENLEYVYKNLEKVIAKGLNRVPELIKKKKYQYEKILSEIQNYLNYIKVGNFSKAVSEALEDAEKRSEILNQEIKLLEFQQQNTFKSPPKEWIIHRLEKLHETLDKNTTASALALKELLGQIRLEPVTESSSLYEIATLSSGVRNDFLLNEIATPPAVSRNDTGIEFRPYYLAHTKIQTLALLDERCKGSNWLHWRTRLQPIRTAGEITAQIKICPIRNIPLYQKFSQKAKELRLLGMSYEQIAKRLNVSKKTIINACKYEKV